MRLLITYLVLLFSFTSCFEVVEAGICLCMAAAKPESESMFVSSVFVFSVSVSVFSVFSVFVTTVFDVIFEVCV